MSRDQEMIGEPWRVFLGSQPKAVDYTGISMGPTDQWVRPQRKCNGLVDGIQLRFNASEEDPRPI